MTHRPQVGSVGVTVAAFWWLAMFARSGWDTAVWGGAQGGLAVYAIVMLVTGMVFIHWMWHTQRQACKNRPRVTPRFRRGWLIGGWCVPIANWVIPKLIIDDLWNRPPTLEEYNKGRRVGRPVPATLVYAVLGGLFSVFGSDPSTILALYAIAHTAAVGAAMLAVQVVRQLTDHLTSPGGTTGR